MYANNVRSDWIQFGCDCVVLVPTDETHNSDTCRSLMLKTVYYLTHQDTGLRLRYYRTLAGARIAQRQRNRSLGFLDRIERIELWDNCEAEQCRLADGTVVTATWCIVEDTIDTVDITEC